MGFGDSADGAFEGVLGGVDFAVVSGLGVAVGFEDGNGCFFFMHVEAEVECAWCARVRFHSYSCMDVG